MCFDDICCVVECQDQYFCVWKKVVQGNYSVNLLDCLNYLSKKNCIKNERKEQNLYENLLKSILKLFYSMYH